MLKKIQGWAGDFFPVSDSIACNPQKSGLAMIGDSNRKMQQIPPLKSIQAFEQVARFGNVAKAAEQLNLTPSAVSHQIANLEALIGRALFVREARGMSLTPAGEQYQREISGILQSLALATERAGSAVGFDCLRLHAAPSFGLLWLLPRLDHFRSCHPEIQINLSCSYETLHFGRHQIDVDIRHGYPDWPSLEVRTIRHERATVLASPSLLERIPVSQPSDLLGQNLILSEAALVQWPQWFAQQGVALPQAPFALGFDRSYMSLEAARHGFGFALESSLLSQDYVKRGDLVPVFPAELSTPVGAHHLVFPRGHAEMSRVRHFLEWVQGQLGHVFNY